MRPSDDLLRTMAAVPVESSVLDLGCGDGRHTEALLRLGFPVHACDLRPDAVDTTRRRVEELIDRETAERCVQAASLEDLRDRGERFNWVVAYEAELYATTTEKLQSLLSATRHLLKPGGWVYLTVPAHPADLTSQEQAGGDGSPTPNSPTAEASAESAPAGAFRMSTLAEQRKTAGLAEAQEAEVIEDDRPRVHVIYRRVE